MKRLFLLALLLAISFPGSAGETAAPELLLLEKKLTAQQESKKNGAATPEQHQAFLEGFRSELTETLNKVRPSPENTSAHARILVLLGAHTEAVANLNRALEERPSDNTLRMSLGQTQLDQKDYAGALASANEVLKTDPENQNAKFLRYQSLGRTTSSAGSGQAPKAPAGISTFTRGSQPAASAQPTVSTRRRTTIAGDPKIQGMLDQPINGDSEIQQTPEKRETPGNGFPLLPVAAMIGFGSMGYGVSRSKETWAEQNSETPAEEDPNSERIRKNRYHFKVAAISAAIGFGVVYGGIWVLGTAVPTIAKVARDGGGSLQRVAVSEAGAINPARAGTIWNSIRATDASWPGTQIPRSFEVTVKSGKYWVHPNASEHMWRYIGQVKSPEKMVSRPPIQSQVLLDSFRSALDRATAQGIQYGKPMNVGQWEFVINKRATDALPVVMHAEYRH